MTYRIIGGRGRAGRGSDPGLWGTTKTKALGNPWGSSFPDGRTSLFLVTMESPVLFSQTAVTISIWPICVPSRHQAQGRTGRHLESQLCYLLPVRPWPRCLTPQCAQRLIYKRGNVPTPKGGHDLIRYGITTLAANTWQYLPCAKYHAKGLNQLKRHILMTPILWMRKV